MYGLPNAQQLDQASVLRLALLANKYDAPKVLSTAVQQLSAQPLSAAAMDLMWQLSGCWEQPFWPLLDQIIKHKLDSTNDNTMTAVTDLLLYVCDRDVEAVWTDSSSVRRDLLLKLPVDALAALLKSSELRAVSEDTVLHTVVQYYEGHTARPTVVAAVLYHQRATLLDAVCFPQLTPTCLFFITPTSSWIDQQLCLLAGFMQHRALSSASLQRSHVPAEWRRGPRSASPKQQHTFQFSINLEEVQEACEEVLDEEPGTVSSCLPTKCSRGHSFGGRQWDLRVWARRAQEGVAIDLKFQPHFSGQIIADSIPWSSDGLLCTCGPHGTASTISKHINTARRISSFIGPLADPEDWRQPAWARNGVVTIDVTVPASCCL